MVKKLTFLLLSIMLMTSVTVKAQIKAFRNQTDESTACVKPCLDRGGVVETTILSEDFSKFTAGSETDPDHVRLDDAETGVISNEYFNTNGWKGSEIYQAGGCAYIGFSETYQETGIIITPAINTSGAIYINCRIRTYDPAGDVVGYNIVDENMEVIDSNVDFIRVNTEWTDVSWFTSAGTENSHIYIFSYTKNILIDDIEIVSLQLPATTLLEETNVGTNNFTANWEAVEDADSYIFKLTAEHTANVDETFYYTNTSFDNVASTGTIITPEITSEMEATVENWHIYMPAFINEAIGITGKYASSEVFGSITSPVLDLSSNKGKVSLSFKALADINEELVVYLITSEYGYYDVADETIITIDKEGWNEYSVEFTNGTNDAYIEITNFGSGNVFFDDLKLSQEIKSGEAKTLVLNELEVVDTSYKANIDQAFVNDILSYQVAARKNVYSTSDKIIGTIDSKFTEAKTVDLVKEEIALDMIRIGEGTIESGYAPISNYGTANYSISQQIYTKDEINMESGNIISISFHNKKGNSNTRKISVFMSNTVQDSYRDSHDWVEIEESQIVFSGDFTFGAQDEWTTIELQKPFTYNGNNIAISVYDASSNSLGYAGNHDSFYSHATDTLRGIYKTSSEKINVYNITDEIYCYGLKTSIYVTPANQYYVNDIDIEIEMVAYDVKTPSVPQNLSANAIDENSISLSWTNTKNATSYNVYRGTEKLANVETTSYLVEGLNSDTQYCFTITALNGSTESEKSAQSCAKTLKEKQIEAPKNLQAWAPAFEAGVISLKWDVVAEASSYNIYRDNEFLVNVKENTYKDTTTYDLHKTYCYKVTAVSASGIESEESNESCAQPLACIGLEELNSSLSIYPNPVKNEIYITSEERIEEVTIYNIYGQKQFTINNLELTMNSLQLNIEHLNSGTYFIKVNETVKKFIKM